MTNNNVYITKTSSFLPGEPVYNQDIEAILGMVGNKPSKARCIVLRSNRIKSRYYAIDRETLKPTYTNAQLTAEAIRRLSDSHFSIDDIQCLATGTSMADQIMPNHAVMVHGELGIPPCEVIATTGVCSSSISAMKYAYMAIASGAHTNAVATGSELASAIMRAEKFSTEHEGKVEALAANLEIAFEKDFLRWMLSDGAGTALLQNTVLPESTALKIEWIEIQSFANEMEPCMYSGADKVAGRLKGWQQYEHEEIGRQSIMAVKQDVKLLNSNVIYYTVEKALSELAQRKNIRPKDIDWFLPHYSSEYFKDKVYTGLKNIDFEIPFEKWFTNLKDKGNTGSASIYIMLDELMASGKLKPDEKILCYVPESGRFTACFILLTVVSG